MKIIYPVCCGVDVHKKMIVATIAATDKNGVTQYFTETFSTINGRFVCLPRLAYK